MDISKILEIVEDFEPYRHKTQQFSWLWHLKELIEFLLWSALKVMVIAICVLILRKIDWIESFPTSTFALIILISLLLAMSSMTLAILGSIWDLILAFKRKFETLRSEWQCDQKNMNALRHFDSARIEFAWKWLGDKHRRIQERINTILSRGAIFSVSSFLFTLIQSAGGTEALAKTLLEGFKPNNFYEALIIGLIAFAVGAFIGAVATNSYGSKLRYQAYVLDLVLRKRALLSTQHASSKIGRNKIRARYFIQR